MEKSTYNRMEEEARKRVRETRVWRGKSEKHVATSSPLPPIRERWMCHGTRIKYFFLFANVELVWVHSFIYYRGDVKYFVIYARSNFLPLPG